MTHDIRNMARVGLALLAILSLMAIACDSSTDTVTDWSNETADSIDEGAEDAGIPRCVSCEVFERITSKGE